MTPPGQPLAHRRPSRHTRPGEGPVVRDDMQERSIWRARNADPVHAAMLATLRHSLHVSAEPSGHERQTAAIVAAFLRAYGPEHVYEGLGGHGLAAVFPGRADGPTVLVRCELDALTVEREPSDPSQDPAPMVRHLCGHDGHMAMVAGLAPLLAAAPPERGRVVLLFQPSEEDGEGAYAVLSDARFAELAPDCGLALHNLPGFPLGTVVARPDVFAFASVGMACSLVGTPSHAAEPEVARAPTGALAHLLAELAGLAETDDDQLITVTHAQMGQPGFGVTPGQAQLFATLRARTRASLHELRARVESAVRSRARDGGLDVRIGWIAEFPETRSHDALVDTLLDVADGLELATHSMPAPFRWSEDFGHFAGAFRSLYFGLGIGEEAPGLHQLDYRFPDELLPIGSTLLEELVRRVLVDLDA